MKEFLTLAAIVGIIAWFVCQPTTVPQLEQSEKERSAEHASMRKSPPAASATVTPANDSVATRWQTGSNGPNDRWKP